MSATLVVESQGAELLRLQEEARSARKRFQFYKARTYGPGVVDPAHLFRLERAFLISENRLRWANPARGCEPRPSRGRVLLGLNDSQLSDTSLKNSRIPLTPR